MMAARKPALAARIAAFWPAGPDPTQRKSNSCGCTLQTRQAAHMVALREHAPPIVRENAQLLEYRALEDHVLLQQLRMQGMGGQKMGGVHGSGKVAVVRLAIVAPIARGILDILGEQPAAHQQTAEGGFEFDDEIAEGACVDHR